MLPSGDEVCACPASWANSMNLFRTTLFRTFFEDVTQAPTFARNMKQLCQESSESLNSFAEIMWSIPTAPRFQAARWVENVLETTGSCIPGMVVGAYACVAVMYFEQNAKLLQKALAIFTLILPVGLRCFEKARDPWLLTAGQAMRQLQDMISNQEVDFKPRPVPLCVASPEDPRHPLIGACG